MRQTVISPLVVEDEGGGGVAGVISFHDSAAPFDL